MIIFKSINRISKWPDRWTHTGFKLSNKEKKSELQSKNGKTILYLDSNGEITYVFFKEVDTKGERRYMKLGKFILKLMAFNSKATLEIAVDGL